jgi:hypothetical protein
MPKQNCWEFKQCGREKENGGGNGICPAVTETVADGVNSGTNGGRICWAIAGTYCDGTVQGTYAHKVTSCLMCEFYMRVKGEEGYQFKRIHFKF